MTCLHDHMHCQMLQLIYKVLDSFQASPPGLFTSEHPSNKGIYSYDGPFRVSCLKILSCIQPHL